MGMTREEAARIIKECKEKGFKHTFYTLNEYHTALDMAIKALEQKPCNDCISRQAVKEQMIKYGFHAPDMTVTEFVEDLLPVIPQTKTGHWLRMSDLSEQEDDRYKCSRCGNVIHYKNKINLYTFNSWCGRCGSDNGRPINYEVEE